MTTPTQPNPGEVLTGESALQAGDLIRHPTFGIATFAPTEGDSSNPVGPWTFIGRPDAQGWIAWAGGENPVPGVDVRARIGKRGIETEGASNAFDWAWMDNGGGGDIIAFRLSLPAPDAEGLPAVVEVGGSDWYAVKGAIERAMQDERDGKPCGSILVAGCEANGYPDPEYAANGFIFDATNAALVALSTRPTDTPPPAAPDDGGLEVVGWVGGSGGLNATTIEAQASRWKQDGYTSEPLVTLTQAQAAIAERDARIAEAEAEVQTLLGLIDRWESSALAAEARAEGMEGALPDLSSVIGWLKNGCAVEHAVTELEIYQARIARQSLTAHQTAGAGS